MARCVFVLRCGNGAEIVFDISPRSFHIEINFFVSFARIEDSIFTSIREAALEPNVAGRKWIFSFRVPHHETPDFNKKHIKKQLKIHEKKAAMPKTNFSVLSFMRRN